MNDKLFQWVKMGITGRSDNVGPFTTVSNMVEEDSYPPGSDLILKCDIEGAEWDVFASISSSNVFSQFQQIFVEFHGFNRLGDIAFANLVRRVFASFCTCHRVVHVHANNYSPWVSVGGIPIPTDLEITFGRLNLGRFTPSDEIFPTPLDMPCNPQEADFYLSNFTLN